MPNSISHSIERPCPNCNTTIQSELWFVVDILERSDLVGLIVDQKLNSIRCSKCNYHKEIEMPLIIYRPDLSPRLILFVNQHLHSSEDQQEFVGAIIPKLRNTLQATWNEKWLEEMPIIELDFLPVLVTKGFGAVQLEYQKQNFMRPMDEGSKLIFEILENLPTEELDTFMEGLKKINNEDEYLEYLNNFPKINQILDAKIEASIFESAEEIEPLADKAGELFRIYQETKEYSMLSQAISAWDVVVTHPLFEKLLSDKKAYMLNDAGVALRTRFDEYNEVTDLHKD